MAKLNLSIMRECHTPALPNLVTSRGMSETSSAKKSISPHLFSFFRNNMQPSEATKRRLRDWSLPRIFLLLLAIASVAFRAAYFLFAQLTNESITLASKNHLITDGIPRITTFNGCELSSRASEESFYMAWVQNSVSEDSLLSDSTSQSIENGLFNTSKSLVGPEISWDGAGHGNDQKTREGLVVGNLNPYDIRMEGKELPLWAKKKTGIRNYPIAADSQMCFVHVDKTAGSTIGCALGFSYDCKGIPYVDGMLSRHTTHIFHHTINDCPEKTKNYVISIRNPLERIRSAHVSDRPNGHKFTSKSLGRREFYEECSFTTLNALAEKGLGPNSNATKVCQRRAYHHVRGTQKFGVHAFYNYQYYRRNIDIDSSANIYVIRAEHLIEDWSNIEFMLGGQGTAIMPNERLNSSSNYSLEGDDYLSARSRRLLCYALCDEIQMYKLLLREAVNLKKTDIATSRAELASSCPHEERATTCPGKKNVNEWFGSKSLKSPFEFRNPDQELPYWAKKSQTLRHQSVPKDQEICFVHVGKTAGSTMGSALGFDYDGPSTSYIDGFLTRYTSHLFHNGFNDCSFYTSKYLISVRNPLERIKSAYVYERPKAPAFKRGKGQGKIYEDCPFPTLDDLAQLGLATGGNTTDICKRRAHNFIRGIEQFSFHAYYNYQYYYSNMNVSATTTMFVVRTEHLLDDWNTVEWLLGGERRSVEVFDRVNPSTHLKLVGDDKLSKESRRLLCAALCEEIQLYKKLLNDAANLNERDIANSYDELAESCPDEAQITSCRSEM